jgi:nucleoid DNA-binding protein
MTKLEIAKRLARQSGVSRAEAADQLDQIVHGILSNLRRGKTAPLPGLGSFTPGPKGVYRFKPDGSMHFEKEKSARHGRK